MIRNTGTRTGVAVAFDGLIADTLQLRTNAVVEGIAAVGFAVDISTVRDTIAGRTVAECVRLACAVAGNDLDETSVDIATLRATRLNAMFMREPMHLVDDVIPWLQGAAISSRLIIRADSERAHVESVLEASGLSDVVSLLLCSDDIATAGTEVPMFVRAWRVIGQRTAAQKIDARNLHGLECASVELCSRVDAGRIHRVTSVTHVAYDALQLS